MDNNIATPPPPPFFFWVDGGHRKKNTCDGGKTWVAGKTEPISPRVAAPLREPMLLRGPEEGCPSRRAIGHLVQWHYPGEIRTYFLGDDIGWTRRGVPFGEDNMSDGTMTPSWKDPDLFPRVVLALTVGQSEA